MIEGTGRRINVIFRNKLREISKVWPLVHDVLTLPHTEAEYAQLVGFLDEVIDVVGEDETHQLASLMDTLGTLVEAYEAKNVPEISGEPIDVLRMLMEEHNLNQTDLFEIGSQGVISEILSGKRQLNIRQIKTLSRRFGVSPAVFI